MLILPNILSKASLKATLKAIKTLGVTAFTIDLFPFNIFYKPVRAVFGTNIPDLERLQGHFKK